MSESKSIEVQLLNTVEAVRSEAIKESLEIANTCLQEHDHSGGQEHGQAMCIYSALQERAGRSGNPRESLRRDLHCSCGAACAPEEYEQHVQMGHDQGEILHRDSVSASSAEPEESLLPCPFCGRAPTIKEVRFTAEVLAASPEPKSYWWIGCEIDAHITGCGIGHSSIDKQEAIRKWNTRAANTAVDPDALHIAICQAVALMNGEIQEGGNAQAHQILRVALADYADRAFTAVSETCPDGVAAKRAVATTAFRATALDIVEEMKSFITNDPHQRHYALDRLAGRIEAELGIAYRSAVPAAQWLPIESAPTGYNGFNEGTVVLLWWPYWRQIAITGYYACGRWHSDEATEDADPHPGPTHWMPLPPPPAE